MNPIGAEQPISVGIGPVSDSDRPRSPDDRSRPSPDRCAIVQSMDSDQTRRTTGSGRLDGAAAIVVGAGQTPGETIGNGRAIALTFAREGADVLCVDRDEARAAETVELIRAAGGAASAIGADISDPIACRAVAAHALERWGRIDILVNNVGIGGHGDGPAHLLDDDGFDLILDVNLVLDVAHVQGDPADRCANSVAGRSSTSRRRRRSPADSRPRTRCRRRA